MEHGMGSWEQVLQQLIAVSGHPIAPVIRLPFLRAEYFKRAFDMGAMGVMVPYVETAEQAAEAVQFSRYPPRGQRGVAKFNRGAEFGGRFEPWLERSHEATLVIAQIESKKGLKNLDAIAATDGVDSLFVGPLDLSVSLGIPQQFDHPDFVAAKAAVVDAVRKHGKAAGILAFDTGQVAGLLAEGFSLLATGSDGGYLSSAFRNLSAESDRIFKQARS
jgi:2-keto-3-deoxy-L-rhamnonate aldolase RhmA